jgi:hypothetical protein
MSVWSMNCPRPRGWGDVVGGELNAHVIRAIHARSVDDQPRLALSNHTRGGMIGTMDLSEEITERDAERIKVEGW